MLEQIRRKIHYTVNIKSPKTCFMSNHMCIMRHNPHYSELKVFSSAELLVFYSDYDETALDFDPTTYHLLLITRWH